MQQSKERNIEKRNWDYIDGLGNDIAKYVSFLSVMSRFHRYPVEDLPSFALEAPATFTAVASANFWTNKFQRTLKSNAQGVTLVRNGQEALYYDISETDGENNRIPRLWQFNEEEHRKYIDATVPGPENTETKIRILAENIVSKSFAKDEDKELVALSAASVALERMGIQCGETHQRLATMSMQNHDVRAVLMNTYSTARGILDAVEKSVSFDANRNVNEAANNPLIQSFGIIDRGRSIEEAIYEEMAQPGMFLGFEDEYSSEEQAEQEAEPGFDLEEETATITDEETPIPNAQNKEEENQEAYEDEEQRETSSDSGVPDAPEDDENMTINTATESIEVDEEAHSAAGDETSVSDTQNREGEIEIISNTEGDTSETESQETDEEHVGVADEFETFLQKPIIHYISREGKFTDSSDRNAFEYHGWIDANGDIHINIKSHDLGTREILPLTPDDAYSKARTIFSEVIPTTNYKKISEISILSGAIMGEYRNLSRERDYMITEGTLVPNVFHSLKRDYEANLITAKEVASELFQAGHFNYIPSEQEALERIGVKEYAPSDESNIQDSENSKDSSSEINGYEINVNNGVQTLEEQADEAASIDDSDNAINEINEEPEQETTKESKLQRMRRGREEMQKVAEQFVNDEITQTNAYLRMADIAKEIATVPKEGIPFVTFIDGNMKRELNDYGDNLINIAQIKDNQEDENSPETAEEEEEKGSSANQGLFEENNGAVESGNLFAGTLEEAVNNSNSDKSTPQTHKIEDFGEKIGGARKDIYSAYREMLSTAGREDMKSVPLSKSWPAPNYLKLLESGVEPWRVHAIRALRDMITPKPKKNRFLGSLSVSSWAIEAEAYRSLAVKVIEGTLDYDSLCSAIDEGDIFRFSVDSSSVRNTNSVLSLENEHTERERDEKRKVTDFRNRVLLYSELGHNRNFSDFKFEYRLSGWTGRMPIPNNSYILKQVRKGSSIVKSFGYTKDEAIGKYREILEQEDELKKQAAENGEKRKREADLRVLKWTNRDYVFIGCKIGRNYVEVDSSFKSFKEGQKYLDEHWDELQEKFASMKELPYERNYENAPRTGVSYRDGEDVTPEKFTEAFGFRGVEFGNWVENKKRQADLNQAYDALMDLATTLKLPPRAMSLCGTLGLAFGARGSGGKNAPIAHYEPAKTVINLTKKSGAGSLAHEWFHALDNYFAKSGGYSEMAMMTEGYSLSSHNQKEVSQSFMDLLTTINTKTELRKRSRNLDKWRTKAYWSTPVEMAARAFETYIKEKLAKDGIRNDYLVNIREVESWKDATESKPHIREDYPYPAGKDELEKITEAYDNLFENINYRMKGEDVLLYSASSPETEKMFAESVSVDYMNLTSEQRAMKMFSEEVLGIQMRYIDGPMELHGQYNSETDTLFANRNGETSLEWTFWHEAFHAMRKFDPELYVDLLKHAEKTEMFSTDQMNEYRKAVNQPNMSDNIVREELMADAFADIKTGRKTLEKVASENRTLAQRFCAFAKKVVESAKRLFNATEEEKTQLTEKYPNAGLSEAQFENFANRIDDIKKDIRDAYGQPLADSKGYRIIESEMPRNMVMSQFTVSPYKYQPEKQQSFDLKAASKLLKEYSADKVESAIRKLSGQKDSKYAEQIMSSVNSYAR